MGGGLVGEAGGGVLDAAGAGGVSVGWTTSVADAVLVGGGIWAVSDALGVGVASIDPPGSGVADGAIDGSAVS